MYIKALAVFVMSLMITGCGTFSSSSMRIEVDVYKGPLANTKSIQKAQLDSILDTALVALNDMDSQLRQSMGILGCREDEKICLYDGPKSKDSVKDDSQIAEVKPGLYYCIDYECKNKKIQKERRELGDYNYRVCPVYSRMLAQVEKLKNAVDKYNSKHTGTIETLKESIKKLLKKNVCNPENELCEELLKAANKSLEELADNPSLPHPHRWSAYKALVKKLHTLSKQNQQALIGLTGKIDQTLNSEHMPMAKLVVRLSEQRQAIESLINNSNEKIPTTEALKDVKEYNDLLKWKEEEENIRGMINRSEYISIPNIINDLINAVNEEKLEEGLNDLVKKLEVSISEYRNYEDNIESYNKNVTDLVLPVDNELQNNAKAYKKLFNILDENLKNLASLAEAGEHAPSEITKWKDVINAIHNNLQNGDFENAKQEMKKLIYSKLTINPFPTPKQKETLLESKKSVDQHLSTFKESVLGIYSSLPKIKDELNKAIDHIKNEGISPHELAVIEKLEQTKATLSAYSKDLGSLIEKLEKEFSISEAEQAEADNNKYGDIAELATMFRVLAGYISYQLASVDAKHIRLKIDMAKLANLAAEYANQLTSRANALSLQTGTAAVPGLDRRNLSTGQYLRDTQPTAFIDLYDWLGAGVGNDRNYKSTRNAKNVPVSRKTGDTTLPIKERVSIAKRLFEDDNWARINEVYASGVGKTSMAFIKDEIGNWNLKSFENDPSELMESYAKLTGKVIKEATGLVSGGAVNAAQQAGELIRMAQITQTGAPANDLRAGQLIGSLDLKKTRKTYQDKIDQIKKDTIDEINKLDDKSKDQKKKELLKNGTDKIKAVVDDYAAFIEALQRVAVIEPKSKVKNSKIGQGLQNN
ncbi:MAG: hypothetical protein PVG39_10685 [Desulfobacteraceae bacterium]|jgi:hypothetical protein